MRLSPALSPRASRDILPPDRYAKTPFVSVTLYDGPSKPPTAMSSICGRSLAHIPPDGQSIKAKSINPIFMFISQQCRSIHLTRANSPPPHPIKIVFVLIVGVKCRFSVNQLAQLMLLSTRSSHESIVRRKPKDKCRPELNENHANQYDDDKSAPWHRVSPDSRDQGNDRRDDCQERRAERQHDSRLSAPDQ